jgi:hypothetical protein
MTTSDAATYNELQNSTTAAGSSFFLANNGSDFNGTILHGNQSTQSVLDELDSCHPLNEWFNCSVDDFLVFARGSKQMPLDTATLDEKIYNQLK